MRLPRSPGAPRVKVVLRAVTPVDVDPPRAVVAGVGEGAEVDLDRLAGLGGAVGTGVHDRLHVDDLDLERRGDPGAVGVAHPTGRRSVAVVARTHTRGRWS